MQSSSDIWLGVAFQVKKRCTPLGNCIGLTLTFSFNTVHQFPPWVPDHYLQVKTTILEWVSVANINGCKL